MNFKGRGIGVFTKFGWGLNCCILSTSSIYAYKYLKRDKKINFDELPKINSRIKITKIKNMRIDTKALNFNL